MATNCCQLVNPRACRSLPCFCTNCSNCAFGIVFRICRKRLHNVAIAGPPPLLRLRKFEVTRRPGDLPQKSNLDDSDNPVCPDAALKRTDKISYAAPTITE